ncbi:CoA pyrophosphatase [Pseudogulbenkiania sp. MAI-1]|uniref:CoA pyrophosphatase n=1 Tax=Pseudogulbenkiania sp. MAI-1 TaxID=990370 RepID=UPI00045E962E|nr:CoA pyrophosphatase [Pseudogulbenkiania sp. MAI-1]
MFPLGVEDAKQWIRSRLEGDWQTVVVGDLPQRSATGGERPAAVLVPLVWHAGAPAVLLTQRTASLSQHAGQVSFPGGKIDPHDQSAVHAALREAREEVGLAEEGVSVLGTLPDYFTITRFRVTPVVGLLVPPLALTPEPSEVAEVFEVPLERVLDPRQYERHSYVRDGVSGTYLSLTFGPHHIWGATAAMLRQLSAILNPEQASF